MKHKSQFSILMRNWISTVGLFLATCTFVTGTFLVIVDSHRHFSNPYIGILIYMVVPALLAGSLFLVVVGMLRSRRIMKRTGSIPPLPVIDLGNRATMRKMLLLWAVLSIFLLVSAVATYRTYHFTESVEFCGEVCHEVMQPEYTAFKNSPHANVTCAKCHIGPGADWFVKAKLSGLYQVYSVLFDKYHRPIETPVHNLRPAKQTCQTCHWPQKFFGAVLQTWNYSLADEENSPWNLKMLMHIGGGNPEHGKLNGIHWHMEGVNSIDYVATDEKRLVIPWVRTVDQDGHETIYRTEEESEAITDAEAASHPKRRMDCIDCHNRPTHQFKSPNECLDLAIFDGSIARSMPEIKYKAGELLAGDYETTDEALVAIEQGLRDDYGDHAGLEAAIQSVKTIYSNNMFPEMKVRWDQYPDHIGHKITPGCFRCHDGKHVSDSGKRIRKDCTICHTILSQGPQSGATLAADGLEFQHPEDIDGEWKEERCDTCHTGSP
jgi:hypothetical protein